MTREEWLARLRRVLRRIATWGRLTCPHCNPTARAIRRVRDQWIAAGIDKGE